MPRRALILCFGVLFGGAAQACDLALTLVPGQGGVVAELNAPCDPYAEVRFAHGPLAVAEETGARGSVSVTLPVLAGESFVTAQIGDRTVTAGRPADLQPSAFFWITPQSLQPGILPAIGFPADPLRPELQIHEDGRPDHLDLRITESTCGQTRRFELMADGLDAPLPIALDLPDCSMAGSVLRLPVPLR